MSLPPGTTVFFELARTLAFVEFTPDAEHIATFEVYPDMPKLLRSLRDAGVRIGAIFACGKVGEDTVRAVLRTSELRDLVEDGLVTVGSPVLSSTFERASTLACSDGDCAASRRLYFVSPDARPRSVAAGAGFVPISHPKTILGALDGEGTLRYLRIRVPGEGGVEWIRVLRQQPLAPFHVTADPCGDTLVYAIGGPRVAAELDDLGFWVDRLGAPSDPDTTAVYLIRDDLQLKSGFLRPAGNSMRLFANEPAALRVLASTPEGLMVALEGDEPIDSFPFTDAFEGHVCVLTPSVTHLHDRYTVAARKMAFTDAAAADPLCECELEILRHHFKPGDLEATVNRYSGADQGPIRSRHIAHPGNVRAVEELLKDLGTIAPGTLTITRNCFRYDRRDLWNVVATLPTSGMPGEGVVVVSAHIDSIANNPCPAGAETGGAPGADELAPGADDDGSGVAAVLETVRTFFKLASVRQQHREVRFVFFNCEEIDRSGSDTYAQAQAALGVQVSAVFHLDMIGYDGKQSGVFEVHAGVFVSGTSNAEPARKRSLEQACLIAHLREPISTLSKAELFTEQDDDGIPRSDHSKFHKVGYPAVWVTEDFFPDTEPGSNLNPSYHTPCDTKIDKDYAAQVARLVAAAAWISATR